MTLDLIGGSSYIWHWKHTIIHHRYVNITGYDTDIDLGSSAGSRPTRDGCGFIAGSTSISGRSMALDAMKVQLVDNFGSSLRAASAASHPPP